MVFSIISEHSRHFEKAQILYQKLPYFWKRTGKNIRVHPSEETLWFLGSIWVNRVSKTSIQALSSKILG